MIFHKEVFIDNVNDWVVGFLGDELLLTEYKGVETIWIWLPMRGDYYIKKEPKRGGGKIYDCDTKKILQSLPGDKKWPLPKLAPINSAWILMTK